MTGIRYMYVRDKNRNPVGVLVMKRRQGGLDYQFSVLNPADDFDRDIGKRLALEALTVNPYSVTMSDNRENDSGHKFSELVMTDISKYKNKQAPTRVVKFARSWLRYNSKKL